MDLNHPTPVSPDRLVEQGLLATWSIAEVELDTGLGKDTLRVWEKRYGFPLPSRDATGERLYPAQQVQRLRVIKRLLDVGHRPGKVVTLNDAHLDALLRETPSGSNKHARKADASQQLALDIPWMQWLCDSRADLLKQSLQQQILRQGLGNTVEHLIAPLCVLVGEAWVRGDIAVFHEHLYTETVQGVLREAIAAVDASSQRTQCPPRVLLTTTPTEQHGLGLLMAECFFALASCERVALGTSTPIPDIVLAVQKFHIDVLALSYSAYASRRHVNNQLRQLVDQLPASVDIWVGGAALALYPRAIPDQVIRLQRASDVVSQVQTWRTRHGPPKPPPLLQATG